MIAIGIFCMILVSLIGALIFWGVGSLITVVFNIDFNWTFLCGICAQLVYMVLYGIFGRDK